MVANVNDTTYIITFNVLHLI